MPWSPNPGSPLDLKLHPRLHVTAATIDSFRDAILVPASAYNAMWQSFATYSCNTYFSTDLSDYPPSGLRHFVLYNLALIHLMRNPAIGDSTKANSVDSTFTWGSPTRTKQAIYDRCRAAMIDRTAWPNPNPANYVPGLSYDRDQGAPYGSFGSNLQVKRTHDVGFALAYDWLYHEFAAQGHTVDRDSVRDWLKLAAEGQRVMDEDFKITQENFSSAVLSRSHSFFSAMAVRGDWSPSADPAAIQDAMDTWQDEYLSGGVYDMHLESTAADGGHSHHGGVYTQYEPLFLILFLDAMLTANGINYNLAGDQSTKSDWLGKHWRWLLALSEPWSWPHGRQLYIADGSWEQRMQDIQIVRMGACLSARLIGGASATNSRFLQWFRNQFSVGDFRDQTVFTFSREMGGSQILLDAPGISPLTPVDAGLPLSGEYCWGGVRVFKTGFPATGAAAYTTQDASIITLGYKRPLNGHDWQGGTGERMPVGLHIAHRGRLIMQRHVNRTSVGGRAPAIVFRSASPPAGTSGLWDSGLLLGVNSKNERLSSYTTGAKSNVGGVQRKDYLSGSVHSATHPYDYERVDHTPHYSTTRVSNYSEEYLIFRPASGLNTKHVYVVAYSRCKRKSTFKPVREFCTAYCPEVSGQHGGLGPEKVADGHWSFTGSNSKNITVRNDRAIDPYNNSYVFTGIDPYTGHTHSGRGVCWVTSILPLDADRTVKVRGGPLNVVNQGLYPRVPAGTVDPAYVDPASWGYELFSDNGEDSPTKSIDFPALRFWPGAPSNDQAVGAFWIGTYTVQIEDNRSLDDIEFLTVFQTGDSALVGTQVRSPTTRLNGTGFDGVGIADPDRYRVAIFSSTGADLISVAYTITSGVAVDHVVSGLMTDAYYTVKLNGVPIPESPVMSTAGGVVYFSTSGGGSFELSQGMVPGISQNTFMTANYMVVS